MKKYFNRFLIWLAAIIFVFSFYAISSGQQSSSTSEKKLRPLTIVQSHICEGVVDRAPVNPTIALSVSRNNAFCFTEIDDIDSPTYVYHNWLRRDAHVFEVKLLIKPPRWSTFSTISLRETDKGPWRVEVTDMEGNILKILRFSVVD